MEVMRLPPSFVNILKRQCIAALPPVQSISSHARLHSFVMRGSGLFRGVYCARATGDNDYTHAQFVNCSGYGQVMEREILVQHLLVEENQLQTLIDLEKRLSEEGIDLSALVSEHSICPSRKDKGMLRWVSKGKMIPEFEQAAFSAPLNKIVRVKTQFGWHLLQVLSEREAGFLVEIRPEELSRRMEDPDFEKKSQLIDVREPNEIEVASIEGFKPFPLSRFGEWSSTILEDLDINKDTYVLCHHGLRSRQVSNWLKSQGFKRVHNVNGGIHAYSTTVDESIPVY